MSAILAHCTAQGPKIGNGAAGDLFNQADTAQNQQTAATF